MARKKSEFLSAWGLAGEVFKSIVNAVLDAGGSDTHLLSIRGDKERLASIAAIIIGSGAGQSADLGASYSAPVSYQLPSYAELNGSVFDWASDLFSDTYTWKEHESVRGRVDRTPGERSFLVKRFNRHVTSEEVIAWADKNGYRVGVREELIALGQTHPGLQRQFPIVALGSFAVFGGDRCVALLRRLDARRVLVSGWFDSGWIADCGFLLLRK